MKTNITALAAMGALLTSFTYAPISLALTNPIVDIPLDTKLIAQGQKDLVTNIPIQETLSDGTKLLGNLAITEFALQNGQLIANGVLSGTATKPDGTTSKFTQNFTDIASTITKQGAGPVCDVLFLDLGPLFLDLLGLTVDLSRVLLDINAVQGSGKLLGNLLCQVTGLLDKSPTAERDNQIQDLLGQINSLLG